MRCSENVVGPTWEVLNGTVSVGRCFPVVICMVVILVDKRSVCRSYKDAVCVYVLDCVCSAAAWLIIHLIAQCKLCYHIRFEPAARN